MFQFNQTHLCVSVSDRVHELPAFAAKILGTKHVIALNAHADSAEQIRMALMWICAQEAQSEIAEDECN